MLYFVKNICGHNSYFWSLVWTIGRHLESIDGVKGFIFPFAHSTLLFKLLHWLGRIS
jgi:hypothetical protein